MKGVIFNVAEEVVTARFGADAWDDVLEAAGLEGVYTSLGNYEDAELGALVAAAASALDVSEAEVLQLIGTHGFARLASRYPKFLDDHTSSRTVLADLNGVIHPRVLTLYPGASVPEFDFSRVGNNIELVYRSDRGLCHLAEGLASGAALSFDEEVDVYQQTCRHRGDAECRIVVDYSSHG